MKMISISALVGCALLTFSAFAQTNDATATAKDAANAWLALIDAAQYDSSWEQAAKPFQSTVSKEQWSAKLRSVRIPLGDVTSRTLRSTSYVTSLPNAPAGEYVVMQYSTTFANKPESTETVTPMKDEHGSWHVSGYYIK
jgi:hypothetical protein